MPTATATIRVSRKTRDLLAQQARERGISLAALLEELAHQAAREAVFRSEREATLAEANDPAALAEYRLWDSTPADGID